MSTPRDHGPSARDLCFIDIETTGATFGHHEIIEIAAVRTCASGETVRGEWARRILPRRPERISPQAQRLTGFSLEAWSGFPHADRSLWDDFVSFASGAMAVCHNPSFDRAFIALSASEWGVTDLKIDYHWIGTESLAWPFLKQNGWPRINLSAICAQLEIPSEPTIHRALEGARTCRRAYLELMRRYAAMLPSAGRPSPRDSEA